MFPQISFTKIACLVLFSLSSKSYLAVDIPSQYTSVALKPDLFPVPEANTKQQTNKNRDRDRKEDLKTRLNDRKESNDEFT